MTTSAGDIIERVYRTWLEPPNSQPIIAYLQSSISVSDTNVTLIDWMVPEDQELMRVGVLLETPTGELLRVRSTNGTDAEVVRERYGTPATAVAVDAEIKVSPMYPRRSIFDSLQTQISTLAPKLYTVKTENLVTVDRQVAGISDGLAVEVIRVFGADWSEDVELDARIVDHHPQTNGRSLIMNGYTGQVWVTYRRRMAAPTTENDLLTALGVEKEWVVAIMAGIAADMLVGRDIPASHFDWISSALEAENIPVRTRQQLAVSLAGYRDYLVDRAQKEMDFEYRPQVHMRSPIRRRVR
jgi:hypothetical protein